VKGAARAGAARPPDIAVIAGEPSGDALGGRLLAALRAETGDTLRIRGVGGPEMEAQGLSSLFPMAELSVMGLAEVLPHLRRLRRRLHDVTAALRADPPDAVVTIDSPGFTLRLHRRLADLETARIHYVAPQVWAWKPGRAKRLARDLDLLLALLPFEPPLFTRHGLPTRFVGHPAVERLHDAPDPGAFRDAHDIPRRAPLLCVLPGSRRSEVDRLLPVFEATAARLATAFPGLHAVVPTVPAVEARLRAGVAVWPVPARVVTGSGERLAAFAAADAALAASGTVATELAVAGTPTVIGYRMNPLSEFAARRLVKLPYVSIPNLVLGREVQPEYLLENCTPDRLAEQVTAFMADGTARSRAMSDGAAAARVLRAGEAPPSRAAAATILEALGGDTASAAQRWSSGT